MMSYQATEPALAPFLYSTILAHQTLDKSLAFLLSNKLCSPSVLGAVQLMNLMQVRRLKVRVISLILYHVQYK